MSTPTIKDYRAVLMDIMGCHTKEELDELARGVEVIPGPAEIKDVTRRAIKLLRDSWEEGE